MLSLLYVPIDTVQNAEQLAAEIIQAKLAVCVNIIPGMTSVYQWQGAVEKSQELLLLIKVKANDVAQTKEFLEAHHPYETPCIAEIEFKTVTD